jgi:hypothetical protein
MMELLMYPEGLGHAVEVLAQFSDRAKLPLIVSGPLFAGIHSLR